MPHRKRLRVRLLFFLITAVAAMAVMLVLLVRHSRSVNNSYEIVQHTTEVMRRADEVHLELLKLESNSRAYVLSGSAIYLKPFYQSAANLQGAVDELRRLTVDNPRQVARLDRLAKLVDMRLEFARKMVRKRANSSAEDAMADVAGGRGKAITDAIERLLAAADAEEIRLLAVRRFDFAAASRSTLLYFVLLVLLLLVALAGIALAIYRHQRARDAAEKTLQLYNHFFTNSNDLLFIAGTDARIEHTNPRFQNALGYSSHELAGRSFVEFVHHDDRPATSACIESTTGERDEHVVNRFRRKDGSYAWMEWIFSTDQPNRHMYGIGRDITRRKQAEDKLLQTNRELESFSYSVSHDLRAPLRAVNGYARILIDDHSDKLTPEAHRLLNTIVRQATRMGELIDALLSFSRLGKKQLVAEDLDMLEMARAVVAEETSGGSRPVDVRMEEILPCRGDRLLIRQVWTNLVSNAVKYTRNSQTPCIRIGSRFDPDGTVYYVRDNGAGFDMQYASKLFGVFQRLHSSDEFEGTGIGLANVLKIVSRHGGAVWAEGRLGEGATFYFKLPQRTET